MYSTLQYYLNIRNWSVANLKNWIYINNQSWLKRKINILVQYWNSILVKKRRASILQYWTIWDFNTYPTQEIGLYITSQYCSNISCATRDMFYQFLLLTIAFQYKEILFRSQTFCVCMINFITWFDSKMFLNFLIIHVRSSYFQSVLYIVWYRIYIHISNI